MYIIIKKPLTRNKDNVARKGINLCINALDKVLIVKRFIGQVNKDTINLP